MAVRTDAYRVLQIDPHAEWAVLHAAYHALARRYHPDGDAPDHARMVELNQAYALVRSPGARSAYDLRRTDLHPVGPGESRDLSSTPTGAVLDPLSAAPYRQGRPDGSPVLDFGRYAGFSLRMLLRHDPDYLRWLARHSSGIRFREHIRQLLGDGQDIERPASAVS